MNDSKILLCFLVLLLQACSSPANRKSDISGRTEYVQQVQPDSPEMQNVNLGVGYLRRGKDGDLDIASEKFKKAIKYNPQFALAHSMLANVYDKKSLFDSARIHYKKSIKYNNGNPNILNNYANFLCQRGQHDLAIEKYQKVVKNPQYKTPESAYENAGVCAKKAGNTEQADDFFRQALTINNKLPNSLYYLMVINLENKKYMKARAFLQRLENVIEYSPEILLAGYKIERGLNHTDLAESYLSNLKKKYPYSDLLKEIQ